MKNLASMEIRKSVANPDLMFVINSDWACFKDKLLPQKIRYKGLIQTQATIRWMQMLANEEIVGNYIQTANLRKLIGYGFSDESAIGSVIAAKSCIPLPLDCIVRGYYVPQSPSWAQYKIDSTICGNHLPEGLKPYQQLSEPIYTPYSTKNGVNVTFEETVEILDDFLQNVFVLKEGSDSTKIAKALATEVKKKSISAYTFAYNYAIQKDIIIADANINLGLLMNQDVPELVLIGNTFTPDSSRMWDARIYRLGEEQYSMGDRDLRKFLSKYDNIEDIPEIPDRILENVSDSYVDVFQRLFDENVIRLSENHLWNWKNALEALGEKNIETRVAKEIQDHFAKEPTDK